MKVVDPSARFGDTGSRGAAERFDPADPPTTDPHEYVPCTYACPRCSRQVRFHEADFMRHVGSEATNLSVTDAEAATLAVQGLDLKGFWFVDFYCPQCALPVRVYFAPETGGKRSGVFLKVVVEGGAGERPS